MEATTTATQPEPTTKKISTPAEFPHQSAYQVQGYGDGEEVALTIDGQQHWLDMTGLARLAAADSQIRSHMIASLTPSQAAELWDDLMDHFQIKLTRACG